MQGKNKRIPISKKLRFEVFKRDGFKCQYCGKSAPDVILHVDHINPVKHGGRNDILNLITACSDCNLGKSATPIDDNSVLNKQMKQMQEISERREQIKLMSKWREELLNLEEEQIDLINDQLVELTSFSFSETGKAKLRKALKKYGFQLVSESLEKAANQYLDFYDNGSAIQRSVNKVVDYIPKICAGTIAQKQHPEIKEIAYICGIAKNRFNYFDKSKAWRILNSCYKAGIEIDDLKTLAKESNYWNEFYDTLEDWLKQAVE